MQTLPHNQRIVKLKLSDNTESTILKNKIKRCLRRILTNHVEIFTCRRITGTVNVGKYMNWEIEWLIAVLIDMNSFYRYASENDYISGTVIGVSVCSRYTSPASFIVSTAITATGVPIILLNMLCCCPCKRIAMCFLSSKK